MADLPSMITDPALFDADAAFWLSAAEAAVRRYCGWHVTPNVALSGALNVRGGRVLRLPAMHVTAVDELTDRTGRTLGHVYDPASGLVECTNSPFPVGVAAVHYRIHAGYAPEEVPDVLGVVVNVAKRAAMSGTGIVASQSTNGSSVSYSIPLMSDEMAKLAHYRIIGGGA